MLATSPAAAYDRAAELRVLDATFSVVRGLVAFGIMHVPRIFRIADTEPPASQETEPPSSSTTIPLIDLGGGDRDRGTMVAAVWRAVSEWGFFQVTSHGVPEGVASAAVDVARAFHEAGGGEGSDKERLHSQEPARVVKYNCNFNLYQSKLANWHDTLYLHITPGRSHADELPDNCR